MTVPGELARVTGLSRPEAGLGNRALVAEGLATMPARGVYVLTPPAEADPVRPDRGYHPAMPITRAAGLLMALGTCWALTGGPSRLGVGDWALAAAQPRLAQPVIESRGKPMLTVSRPAFQGRQRQRQPRSVRGLAAARRAPASATW